eukprot:4584540-Pyramimonas_sp.AAC.1
MAMVRARPPKTRCKAAASWGRVTHAPRGRIRGKVLDRTGPDGGRSLLRRLRHAYVLPRTR